MAKEIRMHNRKCDCGNEISWIDIVELGFKDPDTETVVCKKCKRKHVLEYVGTISEVNGTL